jgi:hypothetical protein
MSKKKTFTHEEQCLVSHSGFRGYRGTMRAKPHLRQFFNSFMVQQRSNVGEHPMKEAFKRYETGKQDVAKYKRAFGIKS